MRMEHQRSGSGNGEDNVGIPDDLRCKRSDGKQWRCTAMSMPDKTVCEKHYIQAKRRAANSALRASLKKAKRKSLGESDVYLESKSDEYDMPLMNMKVEDHPLSVSAKRRGSKHQVSYSPETSLRNLSARNSLKSSDDLLRDTETEENWSSYRTPPFSTMDSSRSRSQRSIDADGMTGYSDDGSTNSSEDTGGQTCHQCRKNDRSRVTWCLKCDRRGFCDSCISMRYSNIPLEEMEKACPACRGICNCKVCLRGDNMVKVKIREIPVLDKLQYLYCLLSSVLPVVKQIHQEQCAEVELEKKLRGSNIDLVRAKLNADEQMCCNICRIPIIDYHRHCANCSYDLCLHCCQDLREELRDASKSEMVENQPGMSGQDKQSEPKLVKASRPRLNLSDKYPDWKANSDGSIPCPPKDHGGCNYSSLNLSRIFKMNWVAKLVKNAEEMVSGCKVSDAGSPQISEINTFTLYQCSNREGSDDNFLYCPTSEVIKTEGINNFRKHWSRGKPAIVKHVLDHSSMSSWDPAIIWRGIRETSDEKMKDENRMVKAINCLDGSEVDIELGRFMKGYSEGIINENGLVQMLKLKDWPSPSASEEFLLYQRPEFIIKLPLLEFIHSRLGLLNVAAKLPHYSLQNDAGPKIHISYGNCEEMGRGDSVSNLHFKMRDMVYLLVHVSEFKLKRSEGIESPLSETSLDERKQPDLSLSEHNMENEAKTAVDKDIEMEDQGIEINSSIERMKGVEDKAAETNSSNESMPGMNDNVVESNSTIERTQAFKTISNTGEMERFKNQQLKKLIRNVHAETRPGTYWDVFRRQDVPNLIEYLRRHFEDFGWSNGADDVALQSLYGGSIFLNGHHKEQLKKEFGVEPWSYEQYLGDAIFVPAGCPFQVRNIQSNVLLGLDFLSPESIGEAARMAEEIRCLPNDHDAKLQILEVGKISLYAASSSIKEVQKLVLDPKLGAEIGFEDPNLTATLSENLEKVAKRRQVTCA